MDARAAKRGFSALGLAITVIAFQNCSPSFHALDGVSSPSSNASAGLPETPTETPVPPAEKTISAAETQPITVNVAAPERLTASPLPTGAIYDAVTGTFRWLPKPGQAGSHAVSFTNASGRAVLTLNLQITAATAIAAGPADGARDGDVGYVFIHGMGDVDRCADAGDLAAYWGAGPATIARGSARTLACYDGRIGAENAAPAVARQILDADCGRFDRCVLVVHSMGALVAEFILTHDRPARANDPEPALFANHELYARAKARTLSVISIASAAGGSRVADILRNQGSAGTVASFMASFARRLEMNTESTRSLTTARATGVLAPWTADPGVPIYMIATYSPTLAWEWDDVFGGFFGALIGNIPVNVFQGDEYLTGLDGIIQTKARSDGLVDFRSGCGLASINSDDGPGYRATLGQQLAYCAQGYKKANHHLWFASNLNHYLAPVDWAGCANPTAPCRVHDYSPSTKSFSANPAYDGMSAVRVARAKLDANRPAEVVSTIAVANGAVSAGVLGGL